MRYGFFLLSSSSSLSSLSSLSSSLFLFGCHEFLKHAVTCGRVYSINVLCFSRFFFVFDWLGCFLSRKFWPRFWLYRYKLMQSRLFICIQSQRFNVYNIFGAAKEIIKKKATQKWYHPNKVIRVANVALALFKAKKQTHTQNQGTINLRDLTLSSTAFLYYFNALS